jgi:hypothetical protein
VQIVVGIGHPVSSGLRSIDYTILPAAMLPHLYTVKKPSATALHCAYLAHHCMLSHSQQDYYSSIDRQARLFTQCNLSSTACGAYDQMPVYTEQVVVFDSLSYYLADPIDFYRDERVQEIRTFASFRSRLRRQQLHDAGGVASTGNYASCAHLTQRLESINLSSDILSAQDLGCQDQEGAGGHVYPRRVHLYHNLQYIKKMHPIMDDILLTIIEYDHAARILCDIAYVTHVLLRLFNRAQGLALALPYISKLSQAQLRRYIIALPRIEHVDYLFLTGLSSVFLNPSPYGAGITSSDALGLCVPVVVFQLSATIHFALAQIQTLGLQKLLVAESIQEYAQLAVQIAHSNMSALCNRLRSGSSADVVLNTNAITYEECMQYVDMKDVVCNHKQRLFSREKLQEAVHEWGSFIERIVK